MKLANSKLMLFAFLVIGTLMACNLLERTGPAASQPPTQTPAPTQIPASATPEPSPAPLPTATAQPAATIIVVTATAPTVVPTAGKNPDIPTTFAKDQVIRFDAGAMKSTLEGSVNSGSFDRYRLSLATGESLDIRLSSTQQTAGFGLLGPDQKPLQGSENLRARWYSANAQTAGEYAILVGSMLGRADYTLVVTVGQPAGTPTGSAGTYAPLPAGDCKQVRSQARNALGVTFSMDEAAFNTAAGERGIACVLAANGTGANFSSVDAAMSALRGAFSDWSEDPAFAADGPTGSSRGLRRDKDLMLITVQWQPSADAQCPADQPISACNLSPEQQLYTVVIQAARR
jgi:hypothetical protein